MSYGATLAWLLFAITLVDHAGPVPDRPGAGSTTRASADEPRDRGDAATASGAPRRAGASADGRRDRVVPRHVRRGRRSLAAFLSPLAALARRSRSRRREQIAQADTRRSCRPTRRRSRTRARRYDVYHVPIDGTTRELALVKQGRQPEQVHRPGEPRRPAPITWQGSWRTLEPVWTFAPALGELRRGLGPDRLPAAAVQHDRDRHHRRRSGRCSRARSSPTASPGSGSPAAALLFTLLIATIFLPAAVTIIPTYTIFVKLGWVGTWLPLLVPTFFANAYDVFLMRQYFMTIPREMDEAAAIDGAGPFRTL